LDNELAHDLQFSVDRTIFAMLGQFLNESLLREHQVGGYINNEVGMPQRPSHRVLSEFSLLRQSVGGIFNLNFLTDRMDAADWIRSRVNLPA
jgi:hypothetical protein